MLRRGGTDRGEPVYIQRQYPVCVSLDHIVTFHTQMRVRHLLLKLFIILFKGRNCRIRVFLQVGVQPVLQLLVKMCIRDSL